jgi:hypothetical protein
MRSVAKKVMSGFMVMFILLREGERGCALRNSARRGVRYEIPPARVRGRGFRFFDRQTVAGVHGVAGIGRWQSFGSLLSGRRFLPPGSTARLRVIMNAPPTRPALIFRLRRGADEEA